MRRDFRAIFLMLLAIYLLTASGHLYSPDEEAMYYVTQGVATSTGVTLPQGDVVPLLARRGIGRQPVSPYGVLPSLLALPLYAAGWLLSGTSAGPVYDYLTRFGVSLLNAPLTALTGALLYVFVRRPGYGRRRGWLAALAFGLCTFAWPYARTFFSEPLAGLLLLMAVERAWTFRSTGNRRALAVSGLAGGLLLATRLAEAVVLPLLALYIVWNREQSAENKTSSYAILSPRLLVALSQWTMCLIPGVALVAGYNMARFGTPLATGYGDESSAFTTPLLTGMYGLLLSPGKSLFLYAPPALLAIPGAWLLWQRQRATTLLLLALVSTHVVMYALWHDWDGGGVWGPRLLLPLVPLLVVLAAPAFGPGGRGRNNLGLTFDALRFTRSSIVITLLLTLGFINALAGVLVNFSVYVNSDVPATQRIYDVARSPLVAHWQILADRLLTRYGSERCVLGDGFFPSEAQHALLPRYTGAHATLTCHADRPVLLNLGVNDYRPPATTPSNLSLQVGDMHVELPAGRSSQVHMLLRPGGALTLINTTWNPARAGSSGRDASVGVLLYRVEATGVDGERLPLVDAAVEPPPASPRLRWGWYFVPYNHHLVDLWPWYLARSAVAPWQQWLVTAGMVGTSLLALAGSARLVFRQPA
ncbi:MAG TPA: hypothetical protein VFT66_01435 [Roseiflexaceae bacterium]|jgi:hypothetical protein|nr:hypothetical protein [Roseiflexaceae bacterium]